jgi:hypothetical protein
MRGFSPFSLWEKGGDEGHAALVHQLVMSAASSVPPSLPSLP